MRHSKRSLEGEIQIDHRSSPALGQTWEGSVYTCSHCQYTVVNNPPEDRSRRRPWCLKCDKYICLECEALMDITLECRSFERRLDEAANEIERFGSTHILL